MAAPRKTIKTVRARAFSAHHILFRTAHAALKRAESKQPGWSTDTLTAIVFSALAIEALSNSIGHKVIPDWERDFESARPLAKLRILAKQLDVPFESGKNPWATARQVFATRNLAAHAKPEDLVETSFTTPKKADALLRSRPQSKLEAQISISKAKSAVKAADAIRILLLDALSPAQRNALLHDSWQSSGELHVGA
jgi:hypothetical protein